jgi:hypothetical protein
MSFFPGDIIKPSASREREITKLLEAARGERASFGINGRSRLEPGHVLVRNDTGADLGFGKAAMIRRLGYYDQDPLPRREPEYRTGFYSAVALAPTVEAMTPSVARMGLAVEPIKQDKFGVVAISGLAVAAYTSALGYVQPVTGGVFAGMFGFARIVSVPQAGQSAPRDFGIWDLSAHNPYNVYEITAISGGAKTATLEGGYSSVIKDNHGIATWQVVGDKGLVFWDGQFWVIVSPWCVGGTE